jgi:hypothetical protein
MRLFGLTFVCFIIMVVFGLVFSGIVGGFVGGLIAGLLAKGVGRGVLVGFFGGTFGALVLALIELFGFILFDETLLSSFLGAASSGLTIVGLIILLAFFGILTSVVGGFIGGFFGGSQISKLL